MKPCVTRYFEMSDGSKSLRASSKDVPTFHRRIFGRIGDLMGTAADQILIPGVNAYNSGEYEEALSYFEKAVANTLGYGAGVVPSVDRLPKSHRNTKSD